MKNKAKLLLPFILLPYFLNGQILFEKGYIITNDSVKKECLIKNIDWENNPASIQFKLNENDSVRTGSVLTINEFCIYGYSIYVSAKVLIDRSSNNLTEITYEKNPKWSDEKLFLKVLVSGNASLYYYQTTNLMRYFYSVNGNEINQLVYKRYLLQNDKINENNLFRQQLWVDLKYDAEECKKIVEQINYKSEELISYFNNYNSFHGHLATDVIKRLPRETFNIKITPGIKYSLMSTTNEINEFRNSKFSQFPTFSLGAELEVILPFNKNKWGVILAPEFNYLNDEYSNNSNYTSILRLNTIELPLGIRHYFFLKNGSKFFVNGFINSLIALNMNSKIDLNNYTSIKLKSDRSFSFGAGYSSKRASIEFRYYAPRNMLSNYVYWSSDYTRISLIFGYKLYSKIR